MDDPFFHESEKSISNLGQNHDCFFFIKDTVWFGFDIMLEITITEFLDDVIIIAAFHYINEVDDVLWL